MAAGLATLDLHRSENMYERAAELSPYFEDAVHSLRGLPHVIDIRNCGLMGAVEIVAQGEQPMRRVTDIMHRCFDKGVLVRISGTSISLSPPLISERSHVDKAVNVLSEAIVESAKNIQD